MNFYKRDFSCQQRVTDSDAGMRERGRIDNDEIDASLISLMNKLYDLVFSVILMEIEPVPQLVGFLFKIALNVGEALVAVNTGFANTQ